jgi:hypothetical protein
MTLYTFIKEEPCVRGPLLAQGWEALYNGLKGFPVLKWELRKLLTITDKLTDAVLFYHGMYVEERRAGKKVPMLAREKWGTDLMEYCYSVVQKMPDYMEATGTLMSLGASYVGWTYPLTAYLCGVLNDRYTRFFSEPLPPAGKSVLETSQLFVDVYVLRYYLKDRTGDIRLQDDDHVSDIVRFCTVHFIQTLRSTSQIFEVKRLLNDTVRGGHYEEYKDKRFNSMNVLRKEHDRQAEITRGKLSKETADITYNYTQQFMDMVKEAGFALPKGPGDLVARGTEHKNCVASYSYQLERGLCIILLGEDATGELRIQTEGGIIRGTICAQYKGKYNRNKIPPAALSDLCGKMVGMYAKDVIPVTTGKKQTKWRI